MKKGTKDVARNTQYEKSKTLVEGFLAPSGEIIPGFKVWTHQAPSVKENPDICFALCLVLSGSTVEKLVLREFDTGNNETFVVSSKDAFNNNEPFQGEQSGDLGDLPHKNCAAVLEFLRARYMQDVIYTTADPLLVAINPFRDIGVATSAYLAKYKEASDVEALPPHIFKVARKALDNFLNLKASQTVIVSGESGAGKTEAAKQVMSFIASCASGDTDNKIQKNIMAANPVLEAFGNAKTIRNNNSSRFGRFVQLAVEPEQGIKNGSVRNFLLEKVRVTYQEPEQRSYHIFYQLLKGANSRIKAATEILTVENYEYLKKHSGGCYDCPGVDDAEDFAAVEECFKTMGMATVVDSVWSVLAGVLRLGNLEFEGIDADGIPDAVNVTNNGKLHAAAVSRNWGLQMDELIAELTTSCRVIGSQTLRSRIRISEAETYRDSLARAVYSHLFDFIVASLNSIIEPSNGFAEFVGLLDIFGFEVFRQNSFEQLLVNITNEELQRNFIQIVFEKETRIYREEGISEAKLEWTDNSGIIEALTGKTQSLLSTLEDTSLAPGGTDQALVSASIKNCTPPGIIFYGNRDKVNNFVVAHTVANVEYSAQGFISKNKDILKAGLCGILQKSSLPIMRELLKNVAVEKRKIAKGQLIASQFQRSLSSLISLINSTEPHFVRCLKPNDTHLPKDWNAAKVLAQLFSLSILEALQLKTLAFSYRRPYTQFQQQFESIHPCVLQEAEGDPKKAVELILDHASISKDLFALGRSMVFLKPEALRQLVMLQRQELTRWASLVKNLQCMIKLYLLRKELNAKIGFLIRSQSHIRKMKASRAKAK